MRWLSIRLDALTTLVSFTVAVIVTLAKNHISQAYTAIALVYATKVCSSSNCCCCCSYSQETLRPRGQWPRGQNFGLGLGLKALALASALASNIWPRPGLGLQQKNQQPRTDGPVFTLPTTGHHTMIEDSYCARENEKLNCVVLIIMI